MIDDPISTKQPEQQGQIAANWKEPTGELMAPTWKAHEKVIYATVSCNTNPATLGVNRDLPVLQLYTTVSPNSAVSRPRWPSQPIQPVDQFRRRFGQRMLREGVGIAGALCKNNR